MPRDLTKAEEQTARRMIAAGAADIAVVEALGVSCRLFYFHRVSGCLRDLPRRPRGPGREGAERRWAAVRAYEPPEFPNLPLAEIYRRAAIVREIRSRDPRLFASQ